MARPTKVAKDKAVAMPGNVAPVANVMPSNVAPRVPVIDVENFIRVRDSVHARLVTLQQLMKSFTEDYLRQTNLILGLNTPGDGHDDVLANIEASMSALVGMPSLSVPQPVVEEKKERKKRTHDPNAPKRPLTPYFLYMQTARPIIANDLGADAPKRAVQDEGQRRWSSMIPSEKAMWNRAYQYNLRLYNARVHSYKHGNPDAKDMTDEESLKYADEHGIYTPADEAADQSAIADQLQQVGSGAVDAQGEDEDLSTPAKKKAAPRKRKSAAEEQVLAGVLDPVAVLASAAVPGVPAGGPDKKRRRSNRPNEDKEEPKKAGRKKVTKP